MLIIHLSVTMIPQQRILLITTTRRLLEEFHTNGSVANNNFSNLCFSSYQYTRDNKRDDDENI